MIVIFLGAPGSGKGTQAKLLAGKFDNIASFSTGDILRTEIFAKTVLGNKIAEIVNSGGYVSDDIMIDLVEKNLSESINNYQVVILDGFPRTIGQAEALDEISKNKLNNCKILVVNLMVPTEHLIERFVGRFTCAKCKTSYHKKFNNTKVDGICDKCGSTEFEVRVDDALEAVSVRLKVYEEKTQPLIDFYKKKNFLVEIDGLNDIESINADILDVLRDNGF